VENYSSLARAKLPILIAFEDWLIKYTKHCIFVLFFRLNIENLLQKSDYVAGVSKIYIRKINIDWVPRKLSRSCEFFWKKKLLWDSRKCMVGRMNFFFRAAKTRSVALVKQGFFSVWPKLN